MVKVEIFVASSVKELKAQLETFIAGRFNFKVVAATHSERDTTLYYQITLTLFYTDGSSPDSGGE